MVSFSSRMLPEPPKVCRIMALLGFFFGLLAILLLTFGVQVITRLAHSKLAEGGLEVDMGLGVGVL